MGDIRSRIREVLNRGYVMSLATLDSGGVWVADLVYVIDDDLSIYWLSKTDTRHSKAITSTPKVAASITINAPHEKDLGLQLEGHAVKIDGDILALAKKHAQKRNKQVTKEGEIFKTGQSWYKLSPTRIELIDQEHHGYEKQILQL